MAAVEHCTIHPATGERRQVAVLYLHGGGLLYGERDDLPGPHLDAITRAGYDLIAADYPLAPETPLPQIAADVLDTWRAMVLAPLRAGELRGWFAFGRSSGAYLALLLTREVTRAIAAGALEAQAAPLGVIDLYGYHDLNDPGLAEPAAAFRAIPKVPRVQALRLVGREPIRSASLQQRFALYVHARQTPGAWNELLGASDPDVRARLSLDADDVASLPPLFVAASADDGEVPYRIPKSLFRAAPSARMKTVFGRPHDFDRDLGDPAGAETYAEAVAWMDEIANRLP